MASSKTPDSIVEARIAEARARGVFDDLPGAGKPLDLGHFDGLGPDERFEALVLRTVGELRPEVVLLREIQDLRATIQRTPDEPTRERLRGTVREKAAQVSALVSEARRAAKP